MVWVKVIRLSASYPSFLSLLEVKGTVHGTCKKHIRSPLLAGNGSVDSLNWCGVFKIKEDGFAFACFSLFRCFLCVGNGTVILL